VGVSESKGKRIKLGQMLVAAGAIEPAQLTKALEEQKRNGGLLGVALVRLGFVDERAIVRALAGQLNLPVVQLEGKQISPEVLELVPVDLVEKHRCLPLLVNGDGDSRVLYLGMEDPSDPDVVAEICTLVGMNVQAVLVAPADLNDGIFRHYECAGFGTAPLSESTAPSPRSWDWTSWAPRSRRARSSSRNRPLLRPMSRPRNPVAPALRAMRCSEPSRSCSLRRVSLPAKNSSRS